MLFRKTNDGVDDQDASRGDALTSDGRPIASQIEALQVMWLVIVASTDGFDGVGVGHDDIETYRIGRTARTRRIVETVAR